MMHAENPKGLELYDRAEDPGESRDLVTDDEIPAKAESLLELANQYLADAKSPWGVDPKEVELDALKLEQLRALGYVLKR